MKSIFTIFFSFFSLSLFANDLFLGKRFTLCDAESKDYDLDYSLEYLDNKIEFEAEMFRDKGAHKCFGDLQFVIGRVWKYEVNKDELITTLQEVKVMVTQKRFIDVFNKNRICGVSNWMVYEFVKCEGKKVVTREELSGYRTVHQFTISEKELELKVGDGDTIKLTHN